MQTLIAVVALAGGLTAANIPERPSWRTDYYEARKVALGNKPLAVFLGGGANGWEKVVREGLDTKVAQLLKEKYVCVFVDTQTEDGKDLARAFAITGKGLVIGDRRGDSQQFHHNGELSATDLAKALERYSDPNRAFVATESLAQLSPPPALVNPNPVPVYRYQPSVPQYQSPYFTPGIQIGGG